MLAAGLILLKTSFSSLTLKVIFLLKTSILEWAVDKNGRSRIKGTSSSLESSLLCLLSTIYSLVLAVVSWERDAFRQYALCCAARIQALMDPHRYGESEKSALTVEIDLTWSRGFVSVELGRLLNHLSCKTLLICPIYISKVLIEAPWFLIAASVEARISLIMFKFSSCLLADSVMNLVSDSSRLGL
ncbi:hypothetical protein Tco_0869394 [Tanacetum coccineum]